MVWQPFQRRDLPSAQAHTARFRHGRGQSWAWPRRGCGLQAARLSAPPARWGMALGVRGRGASGEGLPSETPVTATASSSAVSSRRFLLCLYLVGFLVSARPGAGGKAESLQTWGPGKGCVYLKFPGFYTAPARSLGMCCEVPPLALSPPTSGGSLTQSTLEAWKLEIGSQSR